MVDIINKEKTYMSESEYNDLKAESKSSVNLRSEKVKKKNKTDAQKLTVAIGEKNAEAAFKGLSKDNLVPLNDKVLVKAVIKTRQGTIYLPEQSISNDKDTGLPVEHCEIVSFSPKIEEELKKTYPGLDSGWRCKFNVALAHQVCLGPCLIENSGDYRHNYYTIAIGMIDFVFPPPEGK